MILKFWPRWPRKRPLNLGSIGGHPMDFILNGIFKISGFDWSKWAIDCPILKTFIFQIFNILSFEVVWPWWPRRPRKEPSENFQRLHFWNQFVPLIKMQYRVRYSLDFDLKIRSGQVCNEWLEKSYWVMLPKDLMDWQPISSLELGRLLYWWFQFQQSHCRNQIHSPF